MTEFLTELRRRITRTQQDLAEAGTTGEDYLVGVHLGELESLARLAAEHGVEVPGVRETLTRHGVHTPSPGLPLVGLDGAV